MMFPFYIDLISIVCVYPYIIMFLRLSWSLLMFLQRRLFSHENTILILYEKTALAHRLIGLRDGFHTHFPIVGPSVFTSSGMRSATEGRAGYGAWGSI